ncbi:MAG: SRPBCC family protein [Nocardioides sp.]
MPTTLHPCRRVELDYLHEAPVRFSNTVAIALSPDELFGVLARADTWPRWASVITNVEYTSPEPFGVGTTRVVTMRGGLVGDEEFLAWEPGKHLAFRFNAASTKAVGAFLEDYTIRPTATGCELTWALAQELAGPSKVFSPLTKPVTNVMFRRFLGNLQKLTANGVPA